MRTPVAICLLICLTLACAGEPAGDGLPPDGNVSAAAPATHWPAFGGPDGNFRVQAADLADAWPEGGPPQLWSQPLGGGYSGVAVEGGAVYVASRNDNQDVVQARSVDDGSVVWEQRYDAPARDGHTVDFGTGPNASPVVHDGRLFTLGFAGSLRAWDAKTGDPLWDCHLMDDFGGDLLDFGYSASPIVHDGKLIVLAGGERQGALALDPTTGEVLWSGAPSSVSYSTPIVIDIDGQEQLVYFSAESIVGLDASNGELLWDFPVLNQYRNNSSGPSWGESGLLWVATQLDGGTRALRLSRDGEATMVEEAWVSQKMSVHFWNTLRLGDVVFASIGGNGSILAAIDLTDGDILWRQRGFEKVNLLHAGDKAILLDADGTLALARLSPGGFELLSRATIADETTWTAPALVDGVLYYRDPSSIRAYDLRAR